MSWEETIFPVIATKQGKGGDHFVDDLSPNTTHRQHHTKVPFRATTATSGKTFQQYGRLAGPQTSYGGQLAGYC